MFSSGRFAQFLINFTAHLQCAVNVDYNKGPVYNVYEEKMSMDRGLPSQPIESTLQLYWGSIYMKKIEENVDLFARAYSARTCSITDTPL